MVHSAPSSAIMKALSCPEESCATTGVAATPKPKVSQVTLPCRGPYTADWVETFVTLPSRANESVGSAVEPACTISSVLPGFRSLYFASSASWLDPGAGRFELVYGAESKLKRMPPAAVESLTA